MNEAVLRGMSAGNHGCFAVGCVIGVVLISKLMSLLLKKFHDVTYFAIIGFILGSIAVLFFNYDIFNYYTVWAGRVVENIHPMMPIYIEIPVGIIILLGATALSYLLVRYNRNNKQVNNQEE